MSWSLAPFLVSVALYWAALIPDTQPSLLALVLKCLPTLTCALALHLQNTQTDRQRLVKFGLLFSALGDAALVWPEGFLLGMASFAVGHYFYIRSTGTGGQLLGPRPATSAALAVAVYGAAAAIYLALIRPGLTDPVLAAGVPVYIVWLATTVWRSGVAGDWVMFAGALLFMVSDCIIGINMFHAPVPSSQVWIMSTYQAAQFLITISVFGDQDGDKGKQF